MWKEETIDSIEVFGISQMSDQTSTLVAVNHDNDPSKWSWSPFSPKDILNQEKILKEEKDSVNYSVISNYKSTDVGQKVLLIFDFGLLSFGFINNSIKSNLKFIYIDYAQFTIGGVVNISFCQDKSCKKIIRIENISINLDDIFAVLWYPPIQFNPLFDFTYTASNEKKNKFFFLKRWSQLLKDFTHLLHEDVIWLPGNPFVGSQDWQNKIGEYCLASKIGLNIPPFILTNNEDELRKFVIENNIEKLLLREFSIAPFGLPPYHLTIDNGLPNLKNSPCCFQKYIEKQYELRIIVLFRKIFAYRIYSQDSELAKMDWRVHDDANVKWELTELPDDEKEKLFSLCKQLQLNWGSVDMIYGVDGKYYFLEINRPGVHYWLNAFVGLDITKEIINELKSRLSPSCP